MFPAFVEVVSAVVEHDQSKESALTVYRIALQNKDTSGVQPRRNEIQPLIPWQV